MTAANSDLFSIAFGVILLMCTMYAGGRIHQWYRQALDRDDAFRDGYDRATKSLFSLATRTATAEKDEAAVVRPISAASSARHRAEDRIAKTRQLKLDERGHWVA